MDTNKDKPTETGTLGKLMQVLDCVCLSPRPLRFTEICSALSQVPRGTVHRHLSHLLSEGLLELRQDGTYAAGLKLLTLAGRAWAANDIAVLAGPYLHELADVTGETVHFGQLNGADIVYLNKVESRQAVRMFSGIGNAAPAWCTGVGKAALSLLTQDHLTALARRLVFRPLTPTTIVTPAALVAEIEAIRRTGIAHDREEHETGIRCIAAPVGIAARGLCAGLSITAPAYRMTEDRIMLWQQPLKDIARRLAEGLAQRLGPIAPKENQRR